MKLPSQDAAAREVPEDRSHRVLLPRRAPKPPLRQVARRLLMALLVLLATVLIVWIDRDQYHDNADGRVDLLDCFYYATVTLSTTGYGDIVPYGDNARLLNILLITPLRVLFLIILVGTTLEVLTERTREQWQLKRWSQRFARSTTMLRSMRTVASCSASPFGDGPLT